MAKSRAKTWAERRDTRQADVHAKLLDEALHATTYSASAAHKASSSSTASTHAYRAHTAERADEAMEAHEKAAKEYRKSATQHMAAAKELGSGRSTAIAAALSARAHESGSSADHMRAAMMHAHLAGQAEKSAQEHDQLATTHPGYGHEDRAATARAQAQDYRERQVDHSMLAGSSSAHYPEEGASERLTRRHDGATSTQEQHDAHVVRGTEALAILESHVAKAAELHKQADTQAHFAKQLAPQAASERARTMSWKAQQSQGVHSNSLGTGAQEHADAARAHSEAATMQEKAGNQDAADKHREAAQDHRDKATSLSAKDASWRARRLDESAKREADRAAVVVVDAKTGKETTQSMMAREQQTKIADVRAHEARAQHESAAYAHTEALAVAEKRGDKAAIEEHEKALEEHGTAAGWGGDADHPRDEHGRFTTK